MRLGRHLALVLLRAVLTGAHVPTYTGGADDCFTPPHTHTTSQVLYLKGSGGLEYHIKSNTDPFDIAGGEVLDVDAVFKYGYDQTTYSLFIGCGGCVPFVDPIVELPMALNGYQKGEVEPFTQTWYRSVFAKEARKYDASKLATCTENHFTIRVIDYHNRTQKGHEELVWGAVIGLGEQFTWLELLMFPSYILWNHGDTWTGLWWTYFAVLALTLAASFAGRIFARNAFGLRMLSAFDWQIRLEPRAWCYEFAVIGYRAAGLERLLHLIYAQTQVEEFGYQFGIGVAVLLVATDIPIALTEVIWWGLYHRDEWHSFSSWKWAPLEVLTGVGWLYLFGAGFYIGPFFNILAGLLRFREAYGIYEPRLDKLLEDAGYPPQYESKDEERRPLRGRPAGRVRIHDGGNDHASGRDRMPVLFF